MATGRGGRLRRGVRGLIGAGAIGLAAAPPSATACPDCAAGVRAAVRRGIFDASFGGNLAATLAPFGIFLGVAAAVHSGGHWRRGEDGS